MSHVELPADLLDLPVEWAARLGGMALLRSAVEAGEQLTRPGDDGAIHDFRVAVRRLRSWLRAYRSSLNVRAKAERALKDLARSAGVARDLQVEQGWLREQERTLDADRRAGVDRLCDALARRQAKAERSLRRAIDRRLESIADTWRKSFAAYTIAVGENREPEPPRPMALAVVAAMGRAAGELRRSLRQVDSAADHATIHRARIGAKRLRYVLEPFATSIPGLEPLVRELTALQDTLGELVDAWALLTVIDDDRQDRDAEGESLPEPDRLGFAEIVARLRERRGTAFAALERRWLGGGAGAFFAALDARAADLASRAPYHQEVERKYLLRRVPPHARRSPSTEIEQGYIPGDRLAERLRRVERDGRTHLYRTLKIGRGLVRTEVEQETTPNVFATMWPLTRGRRLRKRRYVVREGGRTWEIDAFTGRTLVLAEIEIPGPETPVEVPAWLAPYVVREVTGEAQYENFNLAARESTVGRRAVAAGPSAPGGVREPGSTRKRHPRSRPPADVREPAARGEFLTDSPAPPDGAPLSRPV